jgi:hypothetical protein
MFPTVDSHHKWNWQRIPGESPVKRGFPQHKPRYKLFFPIHVNGIESDGVAKKNKQLNLDI